MAIINISGLNIEYTFVYEDTITYFGGFLNPLKGIIPDIKLNLSLSEINKIQSRTAKKAELEFMYMLQHLANMLLPFDRVLYHGVSLYIGNQVYLITASSGVGKTTQYMNLQKLYPERIKLINGDKSVLHFSSDHIHLYSSPWKGKERLGNADDAELDGIIILRQDKVNSIQLLEPKDAMIPLLMHYLYNPDNVNDINIVCKMTEKILLKVPVWQFNNTGTLDSSQLLYDTLLKEQEDINE